MINLNNLSEEQRQQYIRIMGPPMATNNIAKNCYGILANVLTFAMNDAHKEVMQRLASAVECLKNCCELNDAFIEKLSDEFEKKYKDLKKEEKTEEKTEEKKEDTDEQKAEELDNKECAECHIGS